MIKTEANRSVTLDAAIWRYDGAYLPAITCKLKPSADYWLVATKIPLTRWELPVNAAQTAQLDLMKAAAELEPPGTELDAFLFMFKIGYRVFPVIMSADVAPADLVLRREAELDGIILECRPQMDADIRESDPPILRKTFDRLIREGFSSEEAVNMITRAFVIECLRQSDEEPDIGLIEQTLSRLPTFPDDTPYSNPSFHDLPGQPLAEEPKAENESDSDEWFTYPVLEFVTYVRRQQKEGISDQTILPVSPFEQLVLDAIEELMTPRLRYVESITAMVRLLSGQDISESSIMETLDSLEARYAVFTWFPDPSQYPDYAGSRYVLTTPIGQRSLKKAKNH